MKSTSKPLSSNMRRALYLTAKPPLWVWVVSALAHAGAILSIGTLYKPTGIKPQNTMPREAAVANVAPAVNRFREPLPTPTLPAPPSIDAPDVHPNELASLPMPDPPALRDAPQPDIPVFRTLNPAAAVRLHIRRLPEQRAMAKLTAEDTVNNIPPDETAAVEADPEATLNPPPIYPRIARMRGYEGLVVLEVALSSDGSCTGVEIVESSGYEILDNAAVDAVQKWEFKPATANGIAVSGKIRVPIRFKLTD